MFKSQWRLTKKRHTRRFHISPFTLILSLFNHTCNQIIRRRCYFFNIPKDIIAIKSFFLSIFFSKYSIKISKYFYFYKKIFTLTIVENDIFYLSILNDWFRWLFRTIILGCLLFLMTISGDCFGCMLHMAFPNDCFGYCSSNSFG